jgi:hypothetical protein
MSYPQYAASLFAGNDFCRSLFAFGAVLFSRPMYLDLGIGKGISLLGGLAVIGIVSGESGDDIVESNTNLGLDRNLRAVDIRGEVKSKV